VANLEELIMSGKTYCVLGGGGSFGIHTAMYLLDHANPKKVIGIGRNPLREAPFSLNIDKRDGYEYHARHLTYEMDLLLEVLDRSNQRSSSITPRKAKGPCRGSIHGGSSRPIPWVWRD